MKKYLILICISVSCYGASSAESEPCAGAGRAASASKATAASLEEINSLASQKMVDEIFTESYELTKQYASILKKKKPNKKKPTEMPKPLLSKKLSLEASLREEAEKGNMLARAYVAIIDKMEGKEGTSITEHLASSLIWIRSQKDNPYAHYALGVMYSYGVAGLDNASNMSTECCMCAAKLGHAKSQYIIAVRYIIGLGGLEENQKEANKWFKEAADQGHEPSLAMLKARAKVAALGLL